MRARTPAGLLLGLLLAVLLAAMPSRFAGLGGLAEARSISPKARLRPTPFGMLGRPLGDAKPAKATPAYLAGSRIAAVGEGALAIDADTGVLFLTAPGGEPIRQVAIARGAGLMAWDPVARLAYVADRAGDRIAVVDTETMTLARSIATPAEPYGVALTPDRKVLLVSTIADRTLVAFDAATGRATWRAPLASEPRGIAVSPDGTRALVAYLTTGAIDDIDLRAGDRVQQVAIASPAGPRRCPRCGNDGDSFARAAFAVTFLGEQQAVVPFQREVPVQVNDGEERVGSYGGGAESPVTHQLAFLRFDAPGVTQQSTAVIMEHQPRALAWDATRDALYVAGLGSDSILQIKNASQASIERGHTTGLSAGETRCGPDGLAVTAAGNVLAWCSFTRSVQRVVMIDDAGALAASARVIAGAPLIATAMAAKQHRGMVLFHAATPAVSQGAGLACASCHPDNRTDGLSWRIDKHELQTPVLAGRMMGTHPFKWDGTDATLRDSLRSTMKRLGGEGLRARDTDALAAYIEALPSVRTPTREAPQVARGAALFEAEGCRSCHEGPRYTDRERHKFAGTLKQSDTPSLLGLAASAPYYHDGSAATLEALLRGRGAVHGMLDASSLTDQQVADLTAFLETL